MTCRCGQFGHDAGGFGRILQAFTPCRFDCTQSLGEHRLPERMFVIHHNLVETAAAHSQSLKIKIVDGLGANSGEGLPLAHHLNWEL